MEFPMRNCLMGNLYRLWRALPRLKANFSADARVTKVILLGALISCTFLPQSAVASDISPALIQESGISIAENASAPSRIANFGNEISSPASKKLAHWVMDSGDNRNLPFVIIDKVNARVFVFDALGEIKGATSALLGLAIGDDSVPGIGQRKLSEIRPNERTTPAGRFVASLDRDIHGKEILWVDYDTAVSLHPVVKGTPSERRAARLASASVSDKRISYGCINVSVSFYEKVVSQIFTGTNGIVYILPETRSAAEVFGSYDVEDPARKQVSTRPVQSSNTATR
ncbi:MAG: hypothetical protein H7315_06730 [Herminiimonas sp.]|nr:hypothetical protein [Herminiimonas sp.]